jgi:predicted DCC family thiol-disulfide oxidoreductase YuxK
MTSPVWLFDGHCMLCSRAVQYHLQHERNETVRFVAIQAREGRALAKTHNIDPDNPDSFLFIEAGHAYEKSDGVLQLLKHVGGWARLLRIGVILPRPVRDWLYDLIARNRYALFGKSDACHMALPKHMQRFVLPESEK